ncbi:MAG TPA: hypothetical protein PKH43_00565 [Saprospiraceae bacterium]|nr:hypothetical protein [Saprospiraceae bacterium]
MTPRLLLPACLIWAACRNTQQPAPQPAGAPGASDTTTTVAVSAAGSDDTPWWVRQGLPEPDTLVVPVDADPLPGVEIMPVGSFHGDEIDEHAARKTWFGLFARGNDSFYLKNTKINQNHIYDPIVDEDESQPGSGWLVTTPLKDSCYVLLKGLEGLKDGPVETVADSFPRKIYPGSNWSFSLGGNSYTLSGEGAMNNLPDEGVVVANYRLWLSGPLDGRPAKQLLVAQPSFDDAMIELLWVGDLDRDGRPDFIFNLSAHYNASETGLFLSSRAAKGKLVRFVNRHISVGC